MIIRAEFERRFDNGRLRRVPIERPSPNYAVDFVPVATPLLPNQTPPTRRQRQVQLLQDVDVFQQDEPLPERIVEDHVPDHYPDLMDCFSSDGFDSKCFGQFARNFLRQNHERCRAEFENVNKEKAKIVSVLAQNLYIMCTLTKD